SVRGRTDRGAPGRGGGTRTDGDRPSRRAHRDHGVADDVLDRADRPLSVAAGRLICRPGRLCCGVFVTGERTSRSESRTRLSVVAPRTGDSVTVSPRPVITLSRGRFPGVTVSPASSAASSVRAEAACTGGAGVTAFSAVAVREPVGTVS